MNVYAQRLSQVIARITAAAESAHREPSDIALLAVSKQQPASAVRAMRALGQRSFGENRAVEGIAKQAELRDLDLVWHFIGPVQSNKTRDIAANFDWVQSVDREKILRRLAMHRPSSLPPLNICLQVNIDNEAQKSGAPPAAVEALAAIAQQLPEIRLRGLMCIPRHSADPDETRASFERLRSLHGQLCRAGYPLDTLSMGMSGDLEIAAACGSTMVRVGTDLFGPRPAANDSRNAETQNGETHQ